MATPPDFAVGQVLTAAHMDAVGFWRITDCTVSSAGGTAATASNGVITVGTSNTSVTVSNAFSSDFTNYRIVISAVDCSVSGFLRLRFGAAVTDYFSVTEVTYSDATATAVEKVNDGTYMNIGTQGVSNDTSVAFDVFAPNLTQRTVVSGTFASNSFSIGYFGGALADNTAYTSFIVFPASGNMTGGTIRVYGYRD